MRSGELGNFGGLLRPSINTIGREAFAWFVGPHLKWKERHDLQCYWESIPPFDPRLPNYDPHSPGTPATPSKAEDGRWDWKDSLQPIRWFFCPCCLQGHGCTFTGNHRMHCRGWKELCCRLVSTLDLIMEKNLLIMVQVCEHGPDTKLVHVGPVCQNIWDDKPCPKGRACPYVHGLDVTAKGIEHRLFHHRKFE